MRIGKFALVGFTGLCIIEVLLFLLTEFVGFYYIISGMMAFEIAVVSNFTIHEKWTFRDRKKKDKWFRRLAKYNTVSIAGMAINTIFLFAFTEFLGIYYLVSNILAAFIVFNWNYFVNIKKTWKYGKKREPLEIPKDPKVSILIPVYSENESIGKIISEIFGIMKGHGIRGEVILIFGGLPDAAGRMIEHLPKEYPVKLIRGGEKGVPALMEGFREAEGDVIGVMNADFSHPPDRIPALVKQIISGGFDISIASRYVKGSRIKGGTLGRRMISKLAVLLVRPLTGVKDPTSGFFFFKKEILKGRAGLTGYKMGLEILIRAESPNVKEIPYTFMHRNIWGERPVLGDKIAYLRHLLKLYWYAVNR